MSEQNANPPITSESPAKSGWWWKVVALFLGVPPIAVYGAEEDVEQEREARRAE